MVIDEETCHYVFSHYYSMVRSILYAISYSMHYVVCISIPYGHMPMSDDHLACLFHHLVCIFENNI